MPQVDFHDKWENYIGMYKYKYNVQIIIFRK